MWYWEDKTDNPGSMTNYENDLNLWWDKVSWSDNSTTWKLKMSKNLNTFLEASSSKHHDYHHLPISITNRKTRLVWCNIPTHDHDCSYRFSFIIIIIIFMIIDMIKPFVEHNVGLLWSHFCHQTQSGVGWVGTPAQKLCNRDLNK